MKCSKNFLKDIPIEKKELVLRKIKEFDKILMSIKNLSEIPNGFWVRKIVGTNIYKFRVNNGDRILFKYNKEKYESEKITFIAYKNHDSQIRAGKNYIHDESNMKILDLEIKVEEYINDQTDLMLDKYIIEEIYSGINNIKNTSLMEDEYIALSVDEKEYGYLSQEQFECLSICDKPIVVYGCAGSGKTLISIRRLLLNEELNIKSLYLTCSEGIKNKTELIFNNFKNIKNNVEFSVFEEFCKKNLENENISVVGYETFYKIVYNNFLVKDINNIRVIWGEINSIIKGTYIDKDMISLDFYLKSKKSFLNELERKKIYKIAKLYNNYLKLNNLNDLNDLALKCFKNISKKYKYEYIIFDEVQELTEKQLKVFELLCSEKQNLMILVDLNQSLNSINFSLNFLKNLLFKKKVKFEEKYILKNYRNTDGIVYWINCLKEFKFKKLTSLGVVGLKDEIPIKNGEKPKIFYNFNIDKDMINFISNDPESAIIVSDEFVKQAFLNEGCAIDRLFTIEEIRGLEYKNIYCYNLIEKFRYIHQILDEKNVNVNLATIYFNMIYIAVTRSTSKLIFLEKKKIENIDIFNLYWKEISDKNEIVLDVEVNISKEKWIIEARRLELMGNFDKAVVIYNKIGMFGDRDICLYAMKKKLELIHLQENKTYIQIVGIEITPTILYDILNYFYDEISIRFDGYLEVRSFYSNYKGGIDERICIEDTENKKEIVDKIYQCINKEYLYKENLTLKVGIVKDQIKIIMNYDYLLVYNHKNKKFDINRCILSDLRLFEMTQQNIEKELIQKIGFNPDNEATKVRMNKKYNDISTESILDFIFKDNF